MKTKLTFKSSEALRRLASGTLQANKFRIPYSDKHTDQKGLLFVKDDGIYVMNAYAGGLPPNKLGTVAYAKGFDPNKDNDVWEKSRHAVGGDDFGEFIGLSTNQLSRLEMGHDLILNVTPTTIEALV